MSYRKDDSGKPRFDLIPPHALWRIAEALTHGAGKYGDRNYLKGGPWGRYYAALQRHCWAWWGGEDKDAESGLSHLAHAAACLLILMEFERLGLDTDDRG